MNFTIPTSVTIAGLTFYDTFRTTYDNFEDSLCGNFRRFYENLGGNFGNNSVKFVNNYVTH